MSGLEVLVALAIAVGVVGVVVPLLPGSLLVLGAILVWALDLRTGTGWAVFAVAALFIGLGAVVKYVVPGRRLKEVGIPTSTLVLGAVLGVIGFFVIPVVGLVIGFVLGVYLSELQPARTPGGLAGDGARAQGGRAVHADRGHRVPARGGHLGHGSHDHMIAVIFSLGAALAYGLSDFLGGVISRRTSVWPVALTACAGAALGTLVLALTVPGDPTGADFAWGLLAGVGSGVGTAFLYRGFARGRMGVVAPVSAVGAALLPAVIGVATGERPSTLVWAGMVVALPGIWLVSREPPAGDEGAGNAEGFLDGILAGVGFGLLFAALGQVPDGAGYWPVMGTQVASMLAVVIAAVLLGGDPRPRRALEWWGLGAGLLASLAVVGFMLARQEGLLSVAAVLTSLYPAFTVLLATLLLGERLHRAQSIGLALCVVCVACVAAG